jgi:hypothetical protein
MCSSVLQVSLKSHNLDRTNLDTRGYHVFLCASGVSEEPQSEQTTLIKKNSSYIRKFGWDRVQSHI